MMQQNLALYHRQRTYGHPPMLPDEMSRADDERRRRRREREQARRIEREEVDDGDDCIRSR